jgi:C1A family cysteine protease
VSLSDVRNKRLYINEFSNSILLLFVQGIESIHANSLYFKKRNMLRLILFSSLLFLILNGCSKDSNNTTPSTDRNTGWFGTDDPTKVPSKVKFGTNGNNLPSAVDLTPKFPPIGDQGQYGTCVGWATAYNVKTAINAIDNNLSTTDVKNPANQFSPKDLFIAIDDAKKGADCNGTNFNDALDVLQSRGVATLATVPYTNLGSCSHSQVQNSWTVEAGNNKIKNYRKIDPNVNSIREQLANNIPVILGAKLSDNFVQWNSDEVMSSNTTYNQVGIHAYHALSIVGYDDSKGPNGAFKVINSWSTNWGSAGHIWIDYNFMINEFSYDNNFYIATNQKGDGNNPDVVPSGNGADLAGWVFDDYSTGTSVSRQTNFNVYNIGNGTVSPSTGWKIYYIYYNAYDANDYGVIFLDEFTTSVGTNQIVCNPSGNYCQINYAFPSGRNLAEVLFGSGTPYLYQQYQMPVINGYYYLVLVVDGDDVIEENDESNNLYYTSYDPLFFVNGYSPFKSGGIQSRSNESTYAFHNSLTPTPEHLKRCINHTAVNQKNRNAYAPDEIVSLIKAEKKAGKLFSHLIRSAAGTPLSAGHSK